MKKCLPLLILICLILLSCATDKGQAVVLPEWFDASLISETSLPFLGKATSESKQQSVINAFDDMLLFMSDYVGQDMESLYRIELITTNAITDFGLTVLEIRSDIAENRQWTTTIVAAASKELVESKMTDSAGKLKTVIPELDKIMSEVSALYRGNYDTEAAALVLKAAALAYGFNIPDERKNTDALIARATQMISDIYIEIGNKDSVLPACSLTVRRARQMIHPFVKKGALKVVGIAFDGFGDIYNSTEQILTDEVGKFAYSSKNANMAATGTLRISVNLDKAVDELAVVVGEDKVAGLRSAIESTEVMHSYYSRTVAVVPETNDPIAYTGRLAICLFEYGKGMSDPSDSSKASKAMLKELEKFGFKCDVVYLGQVPEGLEQMARIINEKYNYAYGYAIVGDVALSGTKKFEDGECYAKVSGTAALFNLATMEMLTILEDLQGGSFGPDADTAERLASEGLASNAAGLFVSRTLKDNADV